MRVVTVSALSVLILGATAFGAERVSRTDSASTAPAAVAVGPEAPILLGEATEGTVYWFGQLLSPPIRFTWDFAEREVLVNGLSLKKRPEWTPPKTVDSALYNASAAQYRLLEETGQHTRALAAEGVRGVALAESAAACIRRSGAIVDSVRAIADGALAIFWRGWHDSDYVPLAALVGPRREIDWVDEARSMAAFYVQSLNDGVTIFFGQQTVFVPGGVPGVER